MLFRLFFMTFTMRFCIEFFVGVRVCANFCLFGPRADGVDRQRERKITQHMYRRFSTGREEKKGKHLLNGLKYFHKIQKHTDTGTYTCFRQPNKLKTVMARLKNV